MKHTIAGLILGAILANSNSAMAAVRTMTFAIENMTCVSCPYIVKKTLAAMPGVSVVEVSYEKKTAVVTFDDAQTTAAALAATSTNAGFPARVVATGPQ